MRGILSILLACATTISFAQTGTVTGTVVDEQGAPVIGASVTIEGTTTGMTTGIDGSFSLPATLESVLVISFIGYEKQTVTVGTQTSIRVVLMESSQQIDDVVVVGYNVVKKSDVTGAVTSVSAATLTERPVQNVYEALQGKAAGVDITSNERPGELGNIYVRGVRSISASSEPLYVVDGVPLMSKGGIETINPHDIQSIDILKDASATAIYGSRGANGVVIVTTKRGREGRFSVDFTSSVTVEHIKDRQKMMDAGEYIEWRRWSYYYADPANYPRGDQPTEANDYQIFLGANDQYAWANIMKGWEGGTWDGSRVETTDWAGMSTRTGVTQDYSLSVSGGTDKLSAYASFGYLNNIGTLKGQDYDRYTGSLRVDARPKKWFEMGGLINASYSTQNYGQSVVGGQASGPNDLYRAAIRNLPYAVPYDDEGNRIIYPGGDDMIKTMVDETKYSFDERVTFRALGSFYAQLNIIDGLKYRIQFGPDFRHWRNGIYLDEESTNRTGSSSYAKLDNRRDFSWTLDNLIYYDKVIDKHSFGATLLQTATAWDIETSSMSASGIPLSSQKWNALNTSNITALDSWDSDKVERQLLSYMIRLNYGWDDKYLLTMSGRWDGASQLADGYKWSFFPSVALGWRIDQEEFMYNTRSWLGQLKLRFGVGVTGNSAVDPYETKGMLPSLIYPYGSDLALGYVTNDLTLKNSVSLANRELGWEKTTQYNIGVDFSFLRGRINGVVDIYTTRTRDLILPMNIPALTGYSTIVANVGDSKNKGIDITLNTVNVKAGDFRWDSSISAAWQIDKMVKASNGKEDDISNLLFIGYPISYRDTNGDIIDGVIYGYESAGIWKEEDRAEMEKFNANGHSFEVGMARPVDQNGDYKIDPNEDRVIIGTTRPKWTIGFNNSFHYKGFELSVMIYGRLGYTYNTGGEWQGGRYTQRSISYYNENNTDADYQKPIYNVAGGDAYYNILGYKSGSFLKIRNISLGYYVPHNFVNRLGIQSAKVYVQAKNPAMIYSGVKWLDLDLGGSTYNRGFTFGLNITF